VQVQQPLPWPPSAAFSQQSLLSLDFPKFFHRFALVLASISLAHHTAIFFAEIDGRRPTSAHPCFPLSFQFPWLLTTGFPTKDS